MKHIVPRNPYEQAAQKAIRDPLNLTTDDIAIIRQRDPWLAEAALSRRDAAWRWSEYQAKHGRMTEEEHFRAWEKATPMGPRWRR